jgi:hypothetical protein
LIYAFEQLGKMDKQMMNAHNSNISNKKSIDNKNQTKEENLDNDN